MLLQEEGHEVVEVEDGREALEEFERRRPDLVVLDLRMPKLSGAEVLDALGSARPPPVILLSASPIAPEIASRYGACVMRKPFDVDALLRMVSSLLDT